MRDLIVDLFCGLGRFPGSNVVSIDIQKRLKPTICADIRFLPLRPNLKPKLVHASPPCKYFSYARLGCGLGYDEKGLAESFRLVAACFDAFAHLQPQTWTLENPIGVLNKILPTKIEITYSAHDFHRKKTNFWSNNRSLKRSLIPQDIRQKILDAC